jgi:hypothetical protein
MNDITKSYSPEVLRAMLAMMGEEGRSELERLAWENKDTDITYQGDKIILPSNPAPMTLEAAIEALERKVSERDTRFDLQEQIPGFPFDAMVAFVKAMKEKYGWASVVPAKSFFDVVPDMHTVRVGPKPKDTIQVPMGKFKIPGVDDPIYIHIAADHSGGTKIRPILCIHANVKLAEKQLIMELVALAKDIMARESIYKGRPLRLKVQPDGEINFGLEPDFIDVSRISKDELVLSKPVMEQVEVSLLTPIKHTQACLEHKIPLKRGILLAGNYGTGKTLTSSVVARVCEEHGWTFIALDDAKGLKGALEFAKQYEPAVVFAEDIDRVSGVRTDKVNDLLNMVDGILTKESKVITVLTTNHVDKINQAMLRPGRLDAVIMVTPPDSEAVQRLLRMYGRGLIATNEPLERIGTEAAGRIPAILREIVERSKLSMVANGRQQVIEDDLLSAYRGMKPHLALLEAPAEATKTAQERLGDALAEIVFQNSPDGQSAKTMENLMTAIPDIMESFIAPVNEGVVNIRRGMGGLGDMHERVKSIHTAVIDGNRMPAVKKERARRDDF